MSPKDVGRMANSEDPDQTAPTWSGSTLFAQAYLSERIITVLEIFLYVLNYLLENG